MTIRPGPGATTLIAAVILNWNAADDTIQCVKSLLEQTVSCRIYIVDNGSTDGSDAQLQSFADTVGASFVANSRNLGFGGGVNRGIRQAVEDGYEFVALLNNDAVAEPTWLSELLRTVGTTGAGAVTGLMLDADSGLIDSAGDCMSTWGIPFPRSREAPATRAPAAGPVFGATGGGTLYHVDTLCKIGLFPEKYFMYFEDVEVSYRMWARGIPVWYTPLAVAHHRRGSSSMKVSGLVPYHMFRNLPLLLARNAPLAFLLRCSLLFYTAYFGYFLNALRTPQRGYAIRGVLAGHQEVVAALRHRTQQPRLQSKHLPLSQGPPPNLRWPELRLHVSRRRNSV